MTGLDTDYGTAWSVQMAGMQKLRMHLSSMYVQSQWSVYGRTSNVVKAKFYTWKPVT